ncbi:MAG: 2-oxoacid:acceptor oxidoreductase family protein [Gammaproteobacteria bacterium]|nr:2-oxoacid:acceptor oxidoreductase family protein [Gammaproteobacteria bacterium]
MTRTEIRLAGFGGQGIGRAGYILGKAIALHEGREAVFTQEYGPESRGGASSSSVVASDEPIDEPFAEHPDIWVVMVQAAFDKYVSRIKPGSRLLIDADLVETHDLPERVEVLAIPCMRFAEALSAKIAANVVMLGCLVAVTEAVVSAESLRESIRTSLPPRTLQKNLEAFERGLAFGLELREGADNEPVRTA